MKRQALGEIPKVAFNRQHCWSPVWPWVMSYEELRDQHLPAWALEVVLNVCFYSWDRVLQCSLQVPL